MDQQRIQRVGGRRQLYLRIHHDVLRQWNLDVVVDIDMGDAAVMTQDRHLGLLLNDLSKPGATAGNDRVQCLPGLDQLQRRLFLRTVDDRAGAGAEYRPLWPHG